MPGGPASLHVVERAPELGVNFIDTADVYGNGHSEALAAQALQGRRDRMIVATKGRLMGLSGPLGAGRPHAPQAAPTTARLNPSSVSVRH
nr:aldo/keto reductase [Deinococcus hopiensis]